jgi:hypothetical protein
MIRKRALILALSALPLLFLMSCGSKTPQPTNDIAPEDITSLSISYMHMARTSAYSYKLEERNGETLFSCHFFNDDFEEVMMSDILVDSGYMREAREIVTKHGFLKMKYKEPDWLDKLVSDAPSYSIVIRGHAGSEPLLLNYFPAGTEELKKLYRSLAETHADEAVITTYE